MTTNQSEDFYRLLFEFSMDAVLYTETSGQILAANPAACDLIKYTEPQICSLGRHGLVDASVSPDLTRMLEEREVHGRTEGELTYIRSDGERFVGWTSSVVIVDGSGRPKTVIIVRDLTDAKKKEAALLQSIRELDDLYNHAPCGYHSVNADGIIVKINRTELSWLGYTREEVIGQAFKDFLAAASQQKYAEKFEQFKQVGSQKDLELELVQKDGALRPIVLNSTAIYGNHSEFVKSRSTVVDVTDRKKLEQELVRQAQTDFLTGLNNRGNFNTIAEREFAVCQRLAIPLGLLFFDLDNFKTVNDTYGHHAGDLVLSAVGDRCIKTLRKIDILGRWGGEEFVALLPGVAGEELRNAAERLRFALSEVNVNIGQNVSVAVTVSIGASHLLNSDISVDSIAKRADTALYSAKSGGKNCVMLYSDILK